MTSNKNKIKEYENRILNDTELNNKSKHHSTIGREVALFIELICTTNEGVKNKKELDLVVAAYKTKSIDMMFWVLYEIIGCYNRFLPHTKNVVLNILKELDDFDVNTYYSVEVGSLKLEGMSDVYHLTARDLGFPIYMLAKTAKLFEWCLNNGADLTCKSKIKEEMLLLQKEMDLKTYNATYQYFKYCVNEKLDSLDCKDVLYKNKSKTYIAVYNKVTKDNMTESIEVSSFQAMLAAMIGDNKEVFNDLEKYRGLISTQSFNGKNLLMYAVDKNCFEWAKKLVEDKYVNPDDYNSHKQSVLLYAINKKRPYMIKLLMDNLFFANDDLELVFNGNQLYIAAICNYPRLAAKIEGHQLFKINKDWIKQHWTGISDVFESEKYIKMLNKESSDYEHKLMTLDLEDLGVKLKVANKKKI